MDPAVPVGGAGRRRPCRRRARLQRSASSSQSLLGFAGSGVLWIAVLVAGISLALRFSWLRAAERIGALDRIAARAPASSASSAPRTSASARRRCASARQVVEVEHELQEEHLPIVIEPTAGRRAEERRASSRSGRSRCSASWSTPSCRRSTCSTPRPAASETVTRRDARDDLAPDREEAEGLRRRGARRRRLARAGDHALRDRAGHRREGRAGRQPRQGPGALAVSLVSHPRRRDDPRQDDDGARAAQREAADDPPVRDPRLAGLQRRRARS